MDKPLTHEEAMRDPDLVLQRFLESVTIEQRLEGLTPQERLKGLTAEEVIAVLTPEELDEMYALLEPSLQKSG